MGGIVVILFLMFSIHAASSASNTIVSNITSISSTFITQSANTSGLSSQSLSSQGSSNQEFLSPKPPSSYEVTENVIDIPDNRTKPPIISSFNLFKPINLANTNINVSIIKNGSADEDNQLKKTSFTYVHITKETNEGGIKKLFKGIRDYVYSLKRGVVDGLHKYFHKHDKDDEKLLKKVDDDEQLKTYRNNDQHYNNAHEIKNTDDFQVNDKTLEHFEDRNDRHNFHKDFDESFGNIHEKFNYKHYFED